MEKITRTVTIVRGLPYSGKSTHAKSIQSNPRYYFSADDFHRTPEGVYDFQIKRAAEAHLWCFQRFVEVVERPFGRESDNVVVDNTNIKLWEVTPYVMFAKVNGWNVRVVTINCPWDELMRRRDNRPEQVVPVEVMERMRDAFELSLPSWETFELYSQPRSSV